MRGSARRKVLEDWPPAFWDNLSSIYITYRSLREFDRRTVFPPKPQQPPLRELNDRQWLRLKRLARHGGPCLDDLHLVPISSSPLKPPQSSQDDSEREAHMARRNFSASSDNSPSSTMVKNITAYDRNFSQWIEENGVFLRSQVTSDNLNQIRSRMKRRRSSLTPSEFPEWKWKRFCEAVQTCETHPEILNGVIPVLLGDEVLPRETERYFNNLHPALKTAEAQLGPPKPDWSNGHKPSLDDRGLRACLGQYIVPSTTASTPILPNMFIEVMRGTENAAVLRRQAIHAGIFGARGMKRVRSLAFDGSAAEIDKAGEAVLVTFYDESIKMYLIHTAEPTSSNREEDYHVNLLGAWLLTMSLEDFYKAATALRNVRDWAEEERESAIRDAIHRMNAKSREELAGEWSPSEGDRKRKRDTVEVSSSKIRREN